MKLPRMRSVLDDLLAVLPPEVAIKIRRKCVFDPCMLVLPAARIFRNYVDETQREHRSFLYIGPFARCVFGGKEALRMFMWISLKHVELKF
jgi:hypothetical protein